MFDMVIVMENKTSNMNFDINNLTHLEQIEDSAMANLSIDVVKAATELNIDCENLEAIDEVALKTAKVPAAAAGEGVPLIVNHNAPKSAKLKSEWSAFSLSMNDAILKIFEFSDRPFIIIRNDKIAYMNKTAMAILELQDEADAIGSNFWNFVDKQDWDMLAQNVGSMLTDDKMVSTRLKTFKERIYKINFQAMYLDDDQNFTFALVGDRKIKYNPGAGLYDAVTGLPNFYLFEDRVQIAVNNEKYKDVRQRKNMMAVLGVSIDNINELKEVNMVDFVFKKLASKLVFRLKKSYTVARGLKYQFWLLINDFNNEHDLEVEIEKIKAIFDEPVAGNYMDFNISTSFGYSVYPTNAKTANKLIEMAVDAIKTAIRYKQS